MLLIAALVAAVAPQTVGRLELDPSSSVHYRHVFNRNAVLDARRLGDDVVALTPGGLLLRFALPAMELEDVVYPDVPIACIGTGADGELLAGGENGGIYRVDAPTLARTRLARAPLRPLWVGAYRSSPSASSSIVVVGLAEGSSQLTVQDLGTGRRFAPPFSAGRIAALLDRQSRLFIGADNGEWGGWAARIDLPDGDLDPYPDCLTPSDDPALDYDRHQFQCDGVYGFVELRDGRVLMHGGMMHMGATSAKISRLDRAGLVNLVDNASLKPGTRYDDPRLPITHVVEHPARDELYVFSFGDVFRSDRTLSRWNRVRKLALSYRFGRPDAVGGYPSVNAVEWTADGSALLVATALDGFVRLRPGAEPHRHVFAADLGAARITRMERAKDGIVFHDGRNLWSEREGDWSERNLVPRSPPRFGLSELSDFGGWEPEIAFVDHGRRLIAVSETNFSPGPRATLRWDGGEPEVLAMEEEHEGYLTGGFATPDGMLWAVGYRGLYQLARDGWQHVAALDMEEGHGPPEIEVLETEASPWYLLERTSGNLFRLWREGELVRVRVVRSDVHLHDAVRWGSRWLFATSGGVRAYDLERGRWSDVRLGAEANAVRVLAVDDAGRLWLAGSGVWVVDGERAIDLSGVPALRGVDVLAMIADPHRRHGVIVSLGARGLLYLATQ